MRHGRNIDNIGVSKHISWRNVAVLILLVLAFLAGDYLRSAKQDKYEAELINRHTKEILMYRDSAIAARNEANGLIFEYRLILLQNNRKIDSLETIINNYRDEKETGSTKK